MRQLLGGCCCPGIAGPGPATGRLSAIGCKVWGGAADLTLTLPMDNPALPAFRVPMDGFA